MPQTHLAAVARDVTGSVLAEIRGLAATVEHAFPAQERRLQLLSDQVAQIAWMLEGHAVDASRPSSSLDANETEEADKLQRAEPGLAGAAKVPSATGDVGAQSRDLDEAARSTFSDIVEEAHSAARQTLKAHFKFAARDGSVAQLWTDLTMVEQWREQGKFDCIVGLHDKCIAISEPPRTGLLARSLEKGVPFFLGVILCNALWMVWSVNWEVANPGKDLPPVFQSVEMVFISVYTLELLLRIAVHRLYFFCNEDMGWNLADLFLVSYSIMDMIFLRDAIQRLSFLRMLRLFKAGKILRLFRVIRFLQELRVMLMCLVGSIGKLVWSILMMIITFYMFSMVFVQGVVSYRCSDQHADADVHEVILGAFGSLEQCLLTLFKISTGESWVPFYEAMLPAGEIYALIFLFFVAFSQIALLNVLTGIFVESAMKLAEPEPEQKAQEKVQEDRKLASDLRRLVLRELRLESDEATFELETLMEHLSGTKLGSYLHYIGVDINEIHHFMVLGAEVTGNTCIDARTFVRACMRVKGWATSLDLQHVLLELKVLHREHNTTLEKVCEAFSKSPKQGTRMVKVYNAHDGWQTGHLGAQRVPPPSWSCE